MEALPKAIKALEKQEKALAGCEGVQTGQGLVRVRRETESASTPMGQPAYFLEFLTRTGLWSHRLLRAKRSIAWTDTYGSS